MPNIANAYLWGTHIGSILLKSFRGLPGLLSDALPGKFGNKVISAWLYEQGLESKDLNTIDRLCYTGQRGMGAHEYKPVLFEMSEHRLSDGSRRQLESCPYL